jgi:hypothetical protein
MAAIRPMNTTPPTVPPAIAPICGEEESLGGRVVLDAGDDDDVRGDSEDVDKELEEVVICELLEVDVDELVEVDVRDTGLIV